MVTTLRRYCLCGATWAVSSDRHTTEALTSLWQTFHEGSGHGPATRQMAAVTRRRADRSRVRGEQAALRAACR